MRFFSSELGHNYSKLTFGYCNYGLLEPGDKPAEMYARGYLPYSGSPDSRGMFYMARSGRLYLPEFGLDSECRRIAKKFDGLIVREEIPLKEFKVTEDFVKFWLHYFDRAHGPAVVTRKRLHHWLDFGIVTHVSTYRNTDGDIAAYALEVHDGDMAHDWYQAWAPELDKKSFGMWVLIDVARTAKTAGKKYYYPGTVYAENIYKTNFPALEFWTGTEWAKDAKNRALKARTKTDDERRIKLLDEWKSEHPLF